MLLGCINSIFIPVSLAIITVANADPLAPLLLLTVSLQTILKLLYESLAKERNRLELHVIFFLNDEHAIGVSGHAQAYLSTAFGSFAIIT